MARINLVETLTKQYGGELRENVVTNIRKILDYNGLSDTQSKTTLIGNVLIEGQEVLRALNEIADDPAFVKFTYSLAAARLAGVDDSPKVEKMVFKLEEALNALRHPDIVKMMQDDLREEGLI